jgi:hypothetical protein
MQQLEAIGRIEDPSDMLAGALAGDCAGASDLRYRAGVSSSTMNLIDQNLALADKMDALGKLAAAAGIVFFAVQAGAKLKDRAASVVREPSDLVGAVIEAAANRGMSEGGLCEAADVSQHDLLRLRTLLGGARALTQLAECAKVEFVAVSAADAKNVRTLRSDLNSFNRRPGSRLPLFA